MVMSFNDYVISNPKGHDVGSLTAFPMANFTRILAANTSDAVIQVPIGFNFPFEGDIYTTLNVSTKGACQLVGTATTLLKTNIAANDNTQLTTLAAGDPIFALWWADIITAETVNGGGVYQLSVPLSNGQKQTIIRWVCYSDVNSVNPDVNIITFEAVFISTGGIKFCYAPIKTFGVPFAPETGTIGVTMLKRVGTIPRSKVLKGSTTPNLSLSTDWPCIAGKAKTWIMAPPSTSGIVDLAARASNVRLSK